jgi:hypothetical protein
LEHQATLLGQGSLEKFSSPFKSRRSACNPDQLLSNLISKTFAKAALGSADQILRFHRSFGSTRSNCPKMTSIKIGQHPAIPSKSAAIIRITCPNWSQSVLFRNQPLTNALLM